MTGKNMISTKQFVFKELSAAQESGVFVSGQELAEKCGVSRTAVWKAIKSLAKDGIKIEGVTNRGYRLEGNEENLSLSAMESLVLPKEGIRFCVYDRLDSTNLEAKRLCAQAGILRDALGALTPEGKKLHKLVIIANEQTAGRGRLGREFYSPAKTGVYLSMIYIPQKNIVHPAKMTAAAAVAVCRVFKRLYKAEPKIKWVNDIFVNGKKVCGILTEGITDFETGRIEAAVIGIGINIYEDAKGFPARIAGTAGSVLGTKGEQAKRNELAAQTAQELSHIYAEQENDPLSSEAKDIIREYKQLNFLLGKTLEITPVIGGEEKYTAKAVDITEDAALVVKKSDGTYQTLQSGEVSLYSKNFLSF